MSVDAARITHFSPDKLKRLGKAPDEVFEILYRELTKADFIIAHNLLGFDVFLIKEWCLLKNLPWEPFLPKMVDTNCLAKGIELKIPYKNGDNFLAYQYRLYHKKQKGLKTNLTFLGKSHNIEHDYENLHDALNDIELLIKVWEKMKYQLCQV
jgi:DNA polymerase III epsilon subunit-like protein